MESSTVVQVRLPQAYGQRMLFTGPDGIGDYKARLIDFPRYIGVGPLSPEGTSDLNYLCRPAPCAPPPMPKQCCIGGVGWGMEYHQLLNSRTLLSNMQIKRAEFRSALEDRVTHRYQNPWQAPPHFLDKQSVGARSKLAWTHKYDCYIQDNNKQFLLNRRLTHSEKR
ncbi:uncharacterized protein C4orf45 [Oncorhynchus kisutch]|uniref:Sperm microtubule inner protein 2 n=1 Tax=Oncorhynchus kisutch TaxID=8019 RepID=A0A8C7G5L0_ONCKI|nr:uncharacterized protein C4orf45 homolog [Oncorhynchus kisutch]